MTTYSKHLKKQPEENIPKNTVTSHQGGQVFETTDKVNLMRFLMLGAEGGTFYVGEKKLTKDNAKSIIALIKKDGVSVVQTLLDVAKAHRAPKQDPLLFVLALCCTEGDPATRQFAHRAISTIAKTSTHLFTFCQNIQDLGGWGRGLRDGVSQFYLSKDDEQIAYQMVKYRQRNGWTHRDVLRLAHPVPETAGQTILFGYAVGKNPPTAVTNSNWIIGYTLAQKETDPKLLAKLIKGYSLTWEMVPNEMLNHPVVLEALLYQMPLTAMMRNLNRFATTGLTKSATSEAVNHICASFTNPELLKKGHIHPVNALNAFKVYGSGRSVKGDGTWTPNQKILDAMHDMFELSFEAVEPMGKKGLVAVDVSGSMQALISNFALTCREAAACLMLTFLKTEPNVEPVYFSDSLAHPKVGKRSSYDQVISEFNQYGGGTNCVLPFDYATRSRNKYDFICVLTDSEDGNSLRYGYGGTHGGLSGNPALLSYANYKIHHNPSCKGIIVGMVANGLSLFPPEDPMALQVAGFDAQIPALINNFIVD